MELAGKEDGRAVEARHGQPVRQRRRQVWPRDAWPVNDGSGAVQSQGGEAAVTNKDEERFLPLGRRQPHS